MGGVQITRLQAPAAHADYRENDGCERRGRCENQNAPKKGIGIGDMEIDTPGGDAFLGISSVSSVASVATT